MSNQKCGCGPFKACPECYLEPALVCATCNAYPCTCPEIRYPSADKRAAACEHVFGYGSQCIRCGQWPALVVDERGRIIAMDAGSVDGLTIGQLGGAGHRTAPVDCMSPYDPGVAMAITGAGAVAQPVTVSLTVDQEAQAWAEWRNSRACGDLLLDMAAGDAEFGDALHQAFMAGVRAAASA